MLAPSMGESRVSTPGLLYTSGISGSTELPVSPRGGQKPVLYRQGPHDHLQQYCAPPPPNEGQALACSCPRPGQDRIREHITWAFTCTSLKTGTRNLQCPGQVLPVSWRAGCLRQQHRPGLAKDSQRGMRVMADLTLAHTQIRSSPEWS